MLDIEHYKVVNLIRVLVSFKNNKKWIWADIVFAIDVVIPADGIIVKNLNYLRTGLKINHFTNFDYL
jgi:hypothetical protein